MQLAASNSHSKKVGDQIALAKGVNINALGETEFIYTDDSRAETSAPSFVRIVGKNGIISEVELEIKLDKKVIKKIKNELSILGSTKNQLIIIFDSNLDGVSYPTSGHYSVNVTKINGSSANLDISIYGVRL